MILGRPGAGKTTFLKRMAIASLDGEFLGDRVPLFVTLKEFAEDEGQRGLIEYVSQFVIPPSPPSKGGNKQEVPLLKGDLGGSQPTQLTDQILKNDRALILLDGLDEVMEKDHDRVIREMRTFAETYSQNHIIITCRIAAREYIFQQFTEVEMADFDDEQIQSFAGKWFKTKEGNNESTTGELFWQELKSRKPVKELATNPLLLTLLCLEFDESASFPQSRAELYERALNVLLAKWDGQRRIKRDEVYKGLSLKRKETLLGQLAMHTFERGDYFFKEHVATKQIEQFIRNLPGASEDPKALMLDSRAVLKSIEAQHGLLAERATGIYSFSHLTFQEYFTAKNILDISHPTTQEKVLQQLIKHIFDKQWREVFLIVVERLDSADYLLSLMKQQIDQSLTNDPALQEFLQWSQQKSASVQVTYKISAVRAFYEDLSLSRARARARALDLDLDPDIVLSLALTLDLTLDRALACDLALTLDLDLARALDLALDLARALDHTLERNRDLNRTLDRAQDLGQDLGQDLELKCQLQALQNRLPRGRDQQWWQRNGKQWCEDLRQFMITHRNIGHDWQFSTAQVKKLTQYYEANLLLVNCLKSECYVSREVREQIEDEILLPWAEIETRRQQRNP
ncbi:NACHT domain-containing NTPase [filamentous cyanobacterium LEGE 11480]|uniref:NACHT domain-containing NTPase n=1 Tax=Romeriopsis navalis LEGE 11480 TaxID=2777977 RepID=A0A928Z3X5_9CYAN|nr:NACHT domain-containing protein [Romeriopsis navalis]MBE9031951.1 NACHT domain-containing NTPase [Romeriopsis navalis LEGE 11480]